MGVFENNTAGTLSVVQNFTPLVKAGSQRKVLVVTSLLGSITNCHTGAYTPYRISKAALNMLVKILATEEPTKDVSSSLPYQQRSLKL